MLAHSTWLLMLLGAATGLTGALLGLGGGVFLVPLLSVGLGVPIRQAIAASLISVIATGSASATVNLRRGLVNMRLGLLLEIATSVGGLAGALASVLLTQRQLFLTFAAMLVVLSAVMLVRSKHRNVLVDEGQDPGTLGDRVQEGDRRYVYRVKRLPVALGSSLAAGVMSGLLGVGGGIVKVPVLSAFCGVPIKVAAATSTFMIGVTAATSAFVNSSRGDLDPRMAAAVCLGALPASLAGAWLSQHVDSRWLKTGLALVLLLVGLRMALASA